LGRDNKFIISTNFIKDQQTPLEEPKFTSPQGQHSFSKFLKGFTFAFQGIKHAFATQINFKFHTFSAIGIIAAGFYFELNGSEWLWIVAAITLVLVAELFNTAFEFLVDLISPTYNKTAGVIKDLASAAVLTTALFALIVALIIFIPKL
jgi:diacylglycerol kinase